MVIFDSPTGINALKLSELTLDRDGLIAAIECRDSAFERAIREEAYRIKVAHTGPEVYLRGLIEISNICRKNCLYCGIRRDNAACARYELSDRDVLEAASEAARLRFGSVVIQGGERTDRAFVRRITALIRQIKSIPTENGLPLGITLSLGEQAREVYEEWFDAGAHRYLLRIESSNPDLFRKIHPKDSLHSFDRRMEALMDLKGREMGLLSGSGSGAIQSTSARRTGRFSCSLGLRQSHDRSLFYLFLKAFVRGILFNVPKLPPTALVVIVPRRVFREPSTEHTHLLGKNLVNAPEAGEGRSADYGRKESLPDKK